MHARVHPPCPGEVLGEVDLRPVLGGREGGDGEERREAAGSPRGTHEHVREVQQDREDASGAVPGRRHERDPEEVVESQSSVEQPQRQGEREEKQHYKELKLHSSHNQGDERLHSTQMRLDKEEGVHVGLHGLRCFVGWPIHDPKQGFVGPEAHFLYVV